MKIESKHKSKDTLRANTLGKLASIYSSRIFPKVSSIRGTHKLRSVLARLATVGQNKIISTESIMERRWDFLIILDACRYDLYQEAVGPCDYVISQGGNTGEWLKKNFTGNYEDIVYISGNPVVNKRRIYKEFGKMPFYHLEEAWDEGWDKKMKTVPPNEVTRSVKEMRKKFPSKKMIIHFIQPHYPFVGKRKLVCSGVGPNKGEEGLDVWNLLEMGKVDEEYAWQAYKDNLKLVMDEVEVLKNFLPGRVVLTADHGNHVGEYGIYGHYYWLRTEELLKVPWVVLKEGTNFQADELPSNLEV